MILFFPVFIPAALGFLFAYTLLRRSLSAHSWLFFLSIALPLGLASCSLILFWSYLIAGGYGKLLTLIVTLSIIVYLFYLNRGNKLFPGMITFPDFSAKLKTWSAAPLQAKIAAAATFLAGLFFLYQFIHYTFYFAGKISWNIFGGWDARYFWNLKAKFLFRSPEHWQAMLTPILDWAHPDYPLMLPAAIAWGWNIAGKEFLLWPPAVDYVFYISLIAFSMWYLRKQISWLAAFLAGSFLLNVGMFRFWSTTQYADIPLAFFFTVAGVFLLIGIRQSDSRLLLFSGLASGISAWTKNEGLFFCAWLSVILLLVTFLNPELRTEKKKHWLHFTAGLAFALIAVLFAKLVLGTEGGEYWGSGRGIQDYAQTLFGNFEKSRFILAAFGVFKADYQQWNGLWILFAAGLIFGILRGFDRYLWIFPLLVLLIEFGYFTVLHFAPSEIGFQLSVSLNRLMMHTAPLALIFTFESIASPATAQSKKASLRPIDGY